MQHTLYQTFLDSNFNKIFQSMLVYINMKHTSRAKGRRYIPPRFHVVLQGRYGVLIKPVFGNFSYRDFQGLLICCREHLAGSKTAKKPSFAISDRLTYLFSQNAWTINYKQLICIAPSFKTLILIKRKNASFIVLLKFHFIQLRIVYAT